MLEIVSDSDMMLNELLLKVLHLCFDRGSNDFDQAHGATRGGAGLILCPRFANQTASRTPVVLPVGLSSLVAEVQDAQLSFCLLITSCAADVLSGAKLHVIFARRVRNTGGAAICFQ